MPTYSITGGADAAFFAIDSVTGALSFRDAPDFEGPADADGDNTYRVEVTARDGSGNLLYLPLDQLLNRSGIELPAVERSGVSGSSTGVQDETRQDAQSSRERRTRQ